MTREVPKDTGKAHGTPRQSTTHSGAGKNPSPPRERTASEGNAAPDPEDHHGEADFSSPPERDEDSGAGNMGAGTEQTKAPEPTVVPSASTSAPPASTAPVSTSTPPAPSKPADAAMDAFMNARPEGGKP
jgi:hypothetical protein